MDSKTEAGWQLRAAAKNSKLTKRSVDQAVPGDKRRYLWDSELRGFGVQIEKSGTKTYFVRYRPKGLGRDGPRRFYKIGRHGELTAEQARQQARSILGQVAAGADPAADLRDRRDRHAAERTAITFDALGQLFLNEHVRSKRTASTASQYERLLRLHACPRLGTILAAHITRDSITQIHLAMRDSPANANRLLAVISSLYSFAAKRGLVPEDFNPVRGIEKYREEGRERYLTSDELKRLGATLAEAETTGLPWSVDQTKPTAKHIPKGALRELLDPYAIAAIRLLLFTGARLREILHLEWNYVDLERGLLFLPKSKTGKKTIILNAPAIEVLKSLLAEQQQEPISVRSRYVIPGDVEGQPRADLKRPWNAVRRHARLEGLRLHDLRHTFASIGAGASLGLPIVGRLLGHSQPQTTARYAHLDADPLRRAADLIGEQISAAISPEKAEN